MPQPAVLEFTGDDEAYLDWIEANPHGFVVNTPRAMPVSYMILHRATCRFISALQPQAGAGGFTERDYIKICAAEVDDLRGWAMHHGRSDGTFTGACPCQPE